MHGQGLGSTSKIISNFILNHFSIMYIELGAREDYGEQNLSISLYCKTEYSFDSINY